MNIYVYVDDILLDGDDADIHAYMSKQGRLRYQYNDDYLREIGRFNIKYGGVLEEDDMLPLSVVVTLRVQYNLRSDGNGRVYFVKDGSITDISNLVLDEQLED